MTALETSDQPADFRARSTRAAGDEKLKHATSSAVLRQYVARQEKLRELPDSDALRTLAGQIKQHALDHLDFYLRQLSANVRQRGGQVHFAATAADARRIVMEIVAEHGVRRVIKSKSMVSEEVDLTPALEAAGLDVVETDLGEFIAQVAHERPSHLVTPIVHKSRQAVCDLFTTFFNRKDCTDDPTFLTGLARAHLREKFRHADMGMTGGNFLIAESGQVCVVENEGNARQSMTTPRVLVSMVGIEKIVPRLSDLAVMLKLLGRSSTGQPMTVYTSIFGGTRKPGEKDGPEHFHLVLVDNGRTEILAGRYRETLRCIRCGACLNACPVYRHIGGHAYGHVYCGPIGALITPLYQGLEHHKDLPQASSLCGACFEACPVKIDIPRYLIEMRKDIVQTRLNGRLERMVFRLWAWAYRSPTLYRIVTTLQGWQLRRRARKQGGWVTKLPKVASGWTDIRDLPAPPKQRFRDLWK